jgi:hypothetical protein
MIHNKNVLYAFFVVAHDALVNIYRNKKAACSFTESYQANEPFRARRGVNSAGTAVFAVEVWIIDYIGINRDGRLPPCIQATRIRGLGSLAMQRSIIPSIHSPTSDFQSLRGMRQQGRSYRRKTLICSSF